MRKKTALTLLSTGLLFAACNYPNIEKLPGERIDNSKTDFLWLTEAPVDLSHPLTLDELVDIAISRSLDLYVQELGVVINEDVALKARYALLPDLNYSYNDIRRNRNTASQSFIYNTTTKQTIPSPIYSIGSPQHIINNNLGFVWNILNFSVNYFRSRQAENEAFLQQYKYDQAKNDIILKVVASYWRAVAAKLALERAKILLPEMREQTAKLQEEIANRSYLTKEQSLGKLVYFFQREIQVQGFNDRNDSSDPTQGYEKEYAGALLDLSETLQLPPGSEFDIYVPSEFPYEANLPNTLELWEMAFLYRPELYQQDLQYKVTADQIRISIAQMFPSVELFNTRNYDHNPFLLYNTWYTAGVNVAWNLLQEPQHFMDYRIGNEVLQRDLVNRYLVSQGIVTQVSLAELLYYQNVEQYLLALQVAKASEAVADYAYKALAVGKKSRLEALQAKIDAYLAFNNVGKIFAALQTNLEQINNAIGIPLFYSTYRRNCEEGNHE